jgi:cytochrome P450
MQQSMAFQSLIIFLTLGVSVLIILRKLQLWLALYHRRSRFRIQHACKEPPRYPNKDPIFGLDVIWKNYKTWKRHNLLPELTSRYQKYGNTYSLVIGGRRVLSTIEPENLKTILSTSFTSFDFGPVRTEALKPLLGESIFTLSGPEWQHSRAMIRPNLSKDQFVDAEMTILEKHFDRLLSIIPKDGSKVDLQPLFFSFTLNAAIALLTGQDVQSSQPSLLGEDDITRIFDDAEKHVSTQVLLASLPFRRSWREYLQACQRCHDWVDRYVHQAIQDYKSHKFNRDLGKGDNAGEKYALLNELVKETYDVPRIRSELIAILTAGRETTASALSSLWFILAKRPDIVKELQVEVDELSGERPDFQRLKKMRYLQNTIQECKLQPYHLTSILAL